MEQLKDSYNETLILKEELDAFDNIKFINQQKIEKINNKLIELCELTKDTEQKVGELYN